MKSFAKLTIFFSVTFAIFFLSAIMLSSISSWISLARVVSAERGVGKDLAEAAWIALSAALYFSILLTLSYSVRNKISASLSIFCIAVLSFAFAAGISLGSIRLDAINPVFRPASPIQAGPGLMLSRSENTIVLLRESSEIMGPRLVSIPGRALIYQEVPLGPNNTILSLPDLPFEDNTPWFIRSVGIDFSLSGAKFKALFEENFLLFAAYAFALILFLSSLRFLLELSQWPLANIFLGALIFRLILSLEIFINSREINVMISSFLAGRAPSTLITPLVFAAMAILTLLYTLLTGIARSSGRKSKRVVDD